MTTQQLAEARYPELTAAFKVELAQMYDTFCRKQLDYGPNAIDQGDKDLTMQGITFRMNDKMQRLRTKVLHNNQYQVNEALEDTLQDLANYAIIGRLVAKDLWQVDNTQP